MLCVVLGSESGDAAAPPRGSGTPAAAPNDQDQDQPTGDGAWPGRAGGRRHTVTARRMTSACARYSLAFQRTAAKYRPGRAHTQRGVLQHIIGRPAHRSTGGPSEKNKQKEQKTEQSERDSTGMTNDP